MKDKKEQHDNSQSKTKILIVDDNSVVRQGLAQLINQEFDLEVCGEAEDANQALNAIEEKQIDLAIVDISLKGTDGIQLTETIRSLWPSLPVLVLSIHDNLMYFKRAFRAGARGYVTKRDAAEKIISAIRKVLGGEIYIGDRMVGKIGDSTARQLSNDKK